MTTLSERSPARTVTAMGILRSRRGVSIVGSVIILITLGVMGAALVGLVASEQESRKISLWKERAFYAVQAGLEYALKEINYGGYPIVTGKPFDYATLTVTIDPDQRRITATGRAGDSMRRYSITTDLLAKDCVSIDYSGAALGGSYQNELTGIVLYHTCLMAVNIASVTISWTPDYGGTVRRISVDGQDLYDELSGTAGGVPIDVADYKFDTQAAVDSIEFSSNMSGKSIDLTLTFTDSSSVAATGIAP